MANISHPHSIDMLNWSLNAVAATRPTVWFAGLANGAPTSLASSEIATATLSTRASAQFAGASSAAGFASASNSVAMTFSFASVATVSGVFIANTASSGAGSGLWYGNLAVVRTPQAGDSLVFAVGALAITLN